MSKCLLTAFWSALKLYSTSCRSLSCAAKVKIWIMTAHPDLIFVVFVSQMIVIHETMKSLISILVVMLASMMSLKGERKSF